MAKRIMSPEKSTGAQYVVNTDTVDDQITRKVLNTPFLTKDIEGFTPGTREIHTNTAATRLQPIRNSQGMIVSDIEVDNPDLDVTMVAYRIRSKVFQNAVDTEFTEFIKPDQSTPISEAITESPEEASF